MRLKDCILLHQLTVSDMNLINFSDEQKEIIRIATNSPYHVVVDAVAGSGKTTTITGIAMADPSKSVIALTYNTHLKNETQERFDKMNITNSQIYTVHGFVYRHYNNDGYNDAIIDDTISKDLPIRKPPDIDILILDEFQDFNWRMVTLVLKLIKDIKMRPKLVVLGDKFQTIYGELQGSDNRFLVYANDIFEAYGKWRRLALQTSYRLTDKVINFMNDVVLQSPLFKSIKTSDLKPTYVVAQPWSNSLCEFILEKIQKGGYAPEDIFILSPSIRSDKQPLYKLTNFLSQNGYPIYASTDLENKSTSAELANKICVNTYHISKGRERSLTIVYNFDSSYFKFYAKNAEKSVVSNTQYVALTRCKNEIILIHDNKEDYLDFLETRKLKDLCDVEYLDDLYYDDKERKSSPYLSVSRLVEYTSFETQKMARGFFLIRTDGQRRRCIELPNQVIQRYKDLDIVENVANLNGVVMSLLYEHHLTGTVAVVEQLKSRLEESVQCDDAGKPSKWVPKGKIRERLVALTGTELAFPEDFLFLALMLESESTGSEHRFKQITDLNWITEEDRANVIDCLQNVCSGIDCQFEVPFETKFQVRGKFILGRVDIIDHHTKTMIELKYVDQISDVHFIQLLLYWYIAQTVDPKYESYSMVLCNVKKGVKCTISPRKGRNVFLLLDYLVMKKFSHEPQMSDKAFIAQAKDLVEKYIAS